ncbi:MAG: thrombospondin type 3 repeat-containing protein [Candidatus Moranbacteria bacterium]|nr:thrombospondin type 3 repeat-containing protein [Candidatus Moranbacteria bacterium]
MRLLKTKNIAVLAASIAVFAITFFAMAQNQNSNTIFLDSDQDGLTDQEEKMIGTDPYKADTDGDGYGDGAEVKSGFNPLKAAPGDQLFPEATVSSANEPAAAPSGSDASTEITLPADAAVPASLFAQSDQATAGLSNISSLSESAINDMSSDPNNPNLTNEMIGELMKLTNDKAATSADFSSNPSYSADDLNQIAQNALEKTDLAKDLPVISDDEIKVLPAIDEKKLEPDEVKAKQKEEIQKYLASMAFVFANNSPFSITTESEVSSQVTAEGSSLIAALSGGDQQKIDAYATKARAGIDQIKQLPVPYVMKDLHKASLQLAIYTLGLKDDVVPNASDPMKSLTALSSLQAVVESGLKIQGEMDAVLKEYGIDNVEMK